MTQTSAQLKVAPPPRGINEVASLRLGLAELPVMLARFEERFAVLVHEESEIRWPIRYLPDSINIGDTVTLKLLTKQQADEEKYVRMRRLLEELIN